MQLYDQYVLPVLLDALCGMKAIEAVRAELIPLARGRVLEIGIGTGRNLPHYDAAQLGDLCGLDPAAQMNAKAQKRARAKGIDIELLTLSAEKIPAADASFDTVVSTFTLCTIPDAVAALREMRRVLKPGGKLLFCEHGTAPDASVRRWQDRLTPYWKPIAGGCHLNRDIRQLLRAGGFVSADLQERYLPGPRAMTYVYSGSAVPA